MPAVVNVLIIEEEPLLALDIESVLADHGSVQVTHYRSAADASGVAGLQGFGLAVVEARLGAAETVALTERLARAGVATVVMSADRKSLELFPHATPLEKPFDARRLLAACDAARARRPGAPHLS
jgi:DNA-binding response OmpR family regulator